jgi:hypothetical protein
LSDAAAGDVTTTTVVGEGDPLGAFVEAHYRARPATRGGKRFNAGEHAWLGSHGAEQACRELAAGRGIAVDEGLFSRIRRAHGRDELQYGELVALSGDFYESPEALFEERPARLPWLWESNDLSDVREVMAEELRWIEAQAHGQRPSPYPDENLRLAWNAKSYVELALRNTDHFGWHNVCAYVRHHGKALQLAADARGRTDETFRRALYTNAFADHFLTDGFAAGHIRVPRAEIRAWAVGRGLGEKVAGALSKLLHDQDGHVDLQSLHGVVDETCRPPEDGLLVQDARANSWRTRCDGQLFLGAGAAQSSGVAQAVAAVAASVRELLLAWKTGELPRHVYAATELVPFPHRDAPALVRKFPGDISEAELGRLWQSVSWYTKIPWIGGIDRRHIRELFQALPELMVLFRGSVAARVASDAEIRARVSAGYIEAYRQIA